jgi:hypothetical protein
MFTPQQFQASAWSVKENSTNSVNPTTPVNSTENLNVQTNENLSTTTVENFTQPVFSSEETQITKIAKWKNKELRKFTLNRDAAVEYVKFIDNYVDEEKGKRLDKVGCLAMFINKILVDLETDTLKGLNPKTLEAYWEQLGGTKFKNREGVKVFNKLEIDIED